VRSNGLSDISMDIYKLKTNLRNWLGEVLNITITVSKESIVDRAHAIKAYWRLEIKLYPRWKEPKALHKFDPG
jgi:hypothetical protein